jgi:hypothetical protein
MSGAIWIGVCILVGALVLELFAPNALEEGFQALAPTVPKAQPTNIITNLLSRRGDVGPGKETSGYIQDARYFLGYADVQRYGIKNDFCRIVLPSGAPEEDAFFACALAGTKGTSPIGFRTKNVRDGLKLSRDDYMHPLLKDGRDAYCRVLKMPDATFQPMCLRALDTGFSEKDERDPEPPEDIKTILDFFAGCEAWLRFRDDMRDYIDRLVIQYAGGLSVPEYPPNPTVTRGLQFNGIDQFVRFGDTSELSLGNRIPMRSIRAFSVWVHFDEFTNNAHIFDFGDGPGQNNVFLGILGKGDPGVDTMALRPKGACDQTTVPTSPSGARFCPEVRPEKLLENSAANIDAYTCPGFEAEARRLPPTNTVELQPAGNANRATLLYEVWDSRLRKVQIKVNRVIPLQRWTHIVVTAASPDAMRPDLNVYINGSLMFTQENGFLPQAKVTTHNYLGKSNWANDTSQYELRDELFSGKIFDFRMYSQSLGETKIKRITQWGLGKLGLDTSFLSVSA